MQEFTRRHNMRVASTLAQMGMIVRGLEGKRLTYAELKQPNGFLSSARA